MLRHVLLAVLAAGTLTAVEVAPTTRLKDGDRVVFVGDSITGLSVNSGPYGFNGVIRRALDVARPGNRIELTSLGGSGQGVGSWLNTEKGSREKETFLDVPKVDVRAALAKPVGVLVIMLGMNDSLSPYIGEDDAAIEGWAGSYRTLIAALRARCQPRVVALATVTPNTEDPASPKNRLLARMGLRLAALAKELDAIVLPTGEAVRDVLAEGRTCRPDFHVTSDFVHPDRAGHAGIAYGMLAGLGEKAAAAEVRRGIDALMTEARGPQPSLSYTTQPELTVGSDNGEFAVTWHWSGSAEPRATLTAPAGWTATPGAGRTFAVRGPLDHLLNRLQLRVEDGTTIREREITIPAPWLIGHGFTNPGVFEHGTWTFQPEKGALPGEDGFMRGVGLGTTPEGWKGPLSWVRWIPSLDHTGGATPGNISLFAVDHCGTFAGAYAARWIKSDRERPVRLTLNSAVFAGQICLQVALRGETVYSGVVTAEAKRPVECSVVLKPGWNALVCKLNHLNWQMQAAVELVGDKPGDLDDLIVSTVPQQP